MRKESLKRLRHLTRWMILCSVLTGIFFSSGEGLQLMPFPESPAAAGASRVRDAKEKVYSFSVHSLQLSLKSKVQKSSDDLISTNRCASEFETAGFSVFRSPKIHFAPDFFYTSRASLIPSGRAPPLV